MQTNLKISHFSSPLSPKEAIALQNDLRSRTRIENDFGDVKIIAGVDVSYDIRNNLTLAFITLLDAKTLQFQEQVSASCETVFPYIPGLLAFREMPAILLAFDKLGDLTPDLLMVDGQGLAHPRRLGIACYLGLVTDIPAIGVAKSRLVGNYAEPGARKGDVSPLMDANERIGTVLRSKEGCNPLFISPGHRVDHETAVTMTLACLTRYRLPEPTRLADKLSKEKPARSSLL